jgi:U3 small nucleolar RNA-associated protein MPP10
VCDCPFPILLRSTRFLCTVQLFETVARSTTLTVNTVLKSSKMNVSAQSDPIDPLEVFLRLLSAPEELAVSRPDEYKQDLIAQTLRTTCQHLFHRLSVLSSLHYKARQKPEKSISDLPSLVLAADESGAGGSGPLFHRAETVWGQIAHVQSGPLRSLVENSLLRLGNTQGEASNLELQVRLLDEGGMSLDGDDQTSTGQGVTTRGGRIEKAEEEEEGRVANEETKRIRARMVRVMNDMDGDRAGSDAELSNSPVRANENGDGRYCNDDGDDESLLDPAVQELNDGIFDFHEMEAFADEEEEYLPDSAFGGETPDAAIKARSLHARLRDGGSPSADDEDRDDEDPGSLLFYSDIQRRRKYRDDEDIDALHKLYESRQTENDDDDDSVLHMTALEMFGAPNTKYFKKGNDRGGGTWKTRHDSHSWVDDEFDRENSQADDAGWTDEVITSGVEGRRSALPADIKRASDGSVDRLTLQGEALEQELIAEKPWQMRGEASSNSRPVNSLLVSRPEYEVAAKLTPTMTAENAALIEEEIKRRVLNDEWDDVIPRELPDVGWSLRRGDQPEVSQEKSKLSLGELYERDYLKKAMGYDVAASESKADLDIVQSEIRSLFSSLCSSLDALSNYQFTPRPVAEATEVRVLATPAIAMEEVLPLHVSEARASAPQEVHLAKRGREGVLRSEAELEPTDRKKARSAKKTARRKARKAKRADEKITSRLIPNSGVENPYERRRIAMELQAARAEGKVTQGQVDSDGNYADSGAFFKRLQNETEQRIQGTKVAATKKKPPEGKDSNSLML